MGRRRTSHVHGVLVVDKARGPTSHDVVGRARRALSTRSVGHAGTLDPLATGVLVLGVGEGTKLLRWLTADDKAYRATVALGVETDTLDAEGEVTARVPASGVTLERARAAAEGFVGTYLQDPPIYSAIKVDGEALHERARRGEEVEVTPREVTVRRLTVLSASDAELVLEVESAKGFYVRSLGRDLARALGTVGHLTALRRTRSGAFTTEEALSAEVLEAAASGDEEARSAVRAALLPLADACRDMPRLHVDAEAAAHAHHGRPVPLPVGEDVPAQGPIALCGPDGALIAVAVRAGERLQVLRGIRT